MLEALEDDYCPSQITPPFAKGHPIWVHNHIPHDMSLWHLALIVTTQVTPLLFAPGQTVA